MRLSVLDLLDQSVIWVDGVGTIWHLEQMEDSHITNLRGWLLRNATKIHYTAKHRLYTMAMLIGGEQASYNLECEIDRLSEENPLTWMEGRELFKAIDDIISERRERAAIQA